MSSNANPKSKIRTCKNKKDQHDLIDMDYIDKLSPAELEFLATFTEQHYEGKGSGRGKRRNDSFTLQRSDAPTPATSFTPEDALLAIEAYSEITSAKKRPRKNQ